MAASEGHLKPSRVHRTGTLTTVGDNLTIAAQSEVRKTPQQGRGRWRKGFKPLIVGRMSGGGGERSYSSRVNGVEREGNEETAGFLQPCSGRKT